MYSRFATGREYCMNQGSPVLGCGGQEDQAEVAGHLPLRSVGNGGGKAHFVIDCRCSFCHAQTTPSGKKAHETAAPSGQGALCWSGMPVE